MVEGSHSKKCNYTDNLKETFFDKLGFKNELKLGDNKNDQIQNSHKNMQIMRNTFQKVPSFC